MKTLPSMFVGLIASLLIILPAAYAEDTWLTSYDGNKSVYALEAFDGKLYAGLVGGSILAYDGNNWTISYKANYTYIESLKAFNGKLYASTGGSAGKAEVLVYDGVNWGSSYQSGDYYIHDLEVYDGKLYAGQGMGQSYGNYVVVFDGANWTISYPGESKDIYVQVLEPYGGKLYAAVGLYQDWGKIKAYDGSAWTTAYADYAGQDIQSLAAYNGKLYAGFGYTWGYGNIIALDGNGWNYSYRTGDYASIGSLHQFNGRLYAGTSNGQDSKGDILAYDGTNWSKSYEGNSFAVRCFAAYDGKLYAGKDYEKQGYGTIIVQEPSCNMPGNSPPCETVSLQEVVAAINQWAEDSMTLGEVIDLIYAWVDPSGHPPN